MKFDPQRTVVQAPPDIERKDCRATHSVVECVIRGFDWKRRDEELPVCISRCSALSYLVAPLAHRNTAPFLVATGQGLSFDMTQSRSVGRLWKSVDCPCSAVNLP